MKTIIMQQQRFESGEHGVERDERASTPPKRDRRIWYLASSRKLGVSSARQVASNAKLSVWRGHRVFPGPSRGTNHHREFRDRGS